MSRSLPSSSISRTVAISPWCTKPHTDLRDASDRELISGNLLCGCWIDGDRAARILRGRRLAERVDSAVQRAGPRRVNDRAHGNQEQES